MKIHIGREIQRGSPDINHRFQASRPVNTFPSVPSIIRRKKVATPMRQLRSSHVVISLFLLWAARTRQETTPVSAATLTFWAEMGSQLFPVTIFRQVVFFWGYQPSSRGSLSGKSTVTDSELPARASTPEGNPPSLPAPKQTSETPSAPGGSSKNPCISSSSPSSSNLGSLADCGLSSSPSSTNNGTSSQASGDQATAHQRPGARSNGQAALPGSASNLTSNTLPSGANSSSSLPINHPLPGVAEKSQSNSGQTTEDQKQLSLQALEAMKHHEEEGEAPLRATPGELGKRGTVLIGRGLETSHGLPSSGGGSTIGRASLQLPRGRFLSQLLQPALTVMRLI
ncbi:hypothetical protein H4Q26_015563 [Puccinia striiformis f. sp. tritici PST-130]|nr:hypothetical protein H4Q26_015563 [Puccinia striiformis f. sp. tritici PST-130]